MEKKVVEILAPAGSFESMTAAVAAGADAVYIGGSRFGARAYANNLEEDRLIEAIEYAHLHGCRLYLTVNTLFKESELSQLYDYLKPYYEAGLDAVIVQDMGAFSYIRRHFPDLPIHASTQMTITGVYGARALKELGADRIVTARELSLEEIREIHENVDVEIESFVHGALCYCYSGQCLFSSLIGGRSGNRGRCAQPCRLPYDVKRGGKKVPLKKNENYLLSLKDLCTLELIPDMIEAGIYSMKIEGRMKSPRYTAGVVAIYRKYVDMYLKNGRKGYRVDAKDKKLLLDLFDRGGLTEGYYNQHNGRDMVALKEKPAFREANQQLFDYLDNTFVNGKKQESIEGRLFIKEGEPVRMALKMGEFQAEAVGIQAETAKNQPMTEEKIRKQMEKTGNTPFRFEKLQVEIEGNVFLPLQGLNELRRNGLEALEKEILNSFRRSAKKEQGAEEQIESRTKAEVWDRTFHVFVEEEYQFPVLLEISEISEIYLDSAGFSPDKWKDFVDKCHENGKKCLLSLPHIFRKEAREYFKKNYQLLVHAGFDGLVIRAMEEVVWLKDEGISLPMVFDFTMYNWNKEAAMMMSQAGAYRLTMPVELNSRELQSAGCEGQEMMIYGYLPMMVSAQCIRRTTEGCSHRRELLYLKDRTGKELPVKNQCTFCYNTIYNVSPQSFLGQNALIKKIAPGHMRLQFTMESPEEIRKIVKAFSEEYIYGGSGELPFAEFTRGHLKRGVE